MKNLTLLLLSLMAMNQLAIGQITVSGTVKNEDFQPLPGANVWLNNKKQVTITNEQGSFEFVNVPAGTNNLYVSYVGYAAFEMVLNGNESSNLSIKLTPSLYITDEIVVSATRASNKTPMTFTNVKKEEIQERNLGQDIPFLLKMTPSIVVTSDAGTGVGYTGMRIRGSDATRVNITINGIPYNDAESQGTFWVDIPDFASSVENIQIQRGVGTSTNGSAAFGGSVNIQTTGFNEKAYGIIDNSFGSFNTRKHSISAGTGLLNNRFTFDARLSKIASDGYIDRATANMESYYLTGGYYGKSTLLRLNVFSGKERTYQSWYGTPESRVTGNTDEMNAYADRNFLTSTQRENLIQSGRTYNFYEYENEVDDYRQDNYQAIFAQDISESITFNSALFYTHGEGFFEQYRADDALQDYGLSNVSIGSELVTSTDLIRRRWLSNDFYGLTYSFNYLKNEKTSLILGGGYNQYNGNHFGNIVWAEFSSDNVLGDRYYDSDSEKKDFNIYGKINHQLTEKVSAFGDIQYRTVNYETQGIDNDRRAISVNENFKFFNPKVGLNVELDKHLMAYVSYSIGNREPVRTDFIDAPENRKPLHETLRNVELGVRKGGGKIQWQFNYYLMNYKNQLVLTGELNDVGSSIRQNVSRSYRTGIEMMAGFSPTPKWQLTGNLTLSQNKISEFSEIVYDYGVNWDEFNVLNNNLTDVDISFSPNVVGGATIAFMPIAGLNISLLSKYVGRQFLDNTGNESRSIDSYFINDFLLSYKIQTKNVKGVEFKLLVNNLLDVSYSSNGYTFGYIGGGSAIQENFYYPQAGLNFLTGLTLNF